MKEGLVTIARACANFRSNCAIGHLHVMFAIFISVNWSVYVIHDAKDRQGKRRGNSVADMTKMHLQYASCKPRPELNISLQLYLWTQ